MKFSISLLLIWSIGSTSVAQENDGFGLPDQVINHGDVAPFDGVLVRPGNYRAFVEDSVEKDITKQMMLKAPVENSSSPHMLILGLGIGFSLSTVLFLVLSK